MNIKVKIDLEVTITLNYQQAKALEAMASYGADPFLKVFKEKLGKSYIEPYEEGVHSLFDEIKGAGRPINKAIQECEKLSRTVKEIQGKEANIK